MKIGITTFHTASNYGAALQAYALQTFLTQAGHSPFFIDHHHGLLTQGVRKYVGRTIEDTIGRWAILRRRATFNTFKRRYLVLSEKTYLCERDLIENPPLADAYICGSDQIWNPNFLKHRKDERAFFLDFGEADVRRISYAASIGVGSMSPDWSHRFAQHLAGFDWVSVREKSALPILAKLGRKDAFWVPDPTLLLTADIYEKNFQLSAEIKELVFSYILDQPIPDLVIRTRQYICQELSLPCFETYERSSLKILINGVPDPCRWLSLLKASRFVVTNSFHGVIFSLIFKRPFIVLPLEGASAAMNTRIESLLERVGLTERLVTRFEPHRITELCASPVNWDLVSENIRDFATIGSTFLNSALAEVNIPPQNSADVMETIITKDQPYD